VIAEAHASGLHLWTSCQGCGQEWDWNGMGYVTDTVLSVTSELYFLCS
jgi:hypothetical protein